RSGQGSRLLAQADLGRREAGERPADVVDQLTVRLLSAFRGPADHDERLALFITDAVGLPQPTQRRPQRPAIQEWQVAGEQKIGQWIGHGPRARRPWAGSGRA